MILLAGLSVLLTADLRNSACFIVRQSQTYTHVLRHAENEDHEATARSDVELNIVDQYVHVLERFAGGRRSSASALLASCVHGDQEPNAVLGTRMKYHVAMKTPFIITLNTLRLRGNQVCRLTPWPVGPCRAIP